MSESSKIHLAAGDIRFVELRIFAAAIQKLDTDLPNLLDADPLRAAIAGDLTVTIDRVLEMVKSALVVDGHEISDALPLRKHVPRRDVERVEPFDADLNERLRQLYREVEEETIAVTRLRKEGPARVEEAWERALSRVGASAGDDLAEEPEVVLPSLKGLADDYAYSLQQLQVLQDLLLNQEQLVVRASRVCDFLEEKE